MNKNKLKWLNVGQRVTKSKIILTDRQKVWLCRHYHDTESPIIADLMGISVSSVHRFARQLGLKKSEAGLKRIRQRQAQHIKEVCTANGYYESLKGRSMEKANEGYQRFLEEHPGFSPMKQLKEKDPKKYAQVCAEWSKKGKTRFRLYRTRFELGLNVKTKFGQQMYDNTLALTKREISRRWLAKRRNYILGDLDPKFDERMVLYFDADTERSEQFERNCVKAGFKILPLPDDDCAIAQ